ncbi:MAG: adenylate/guanylate cyclase domain-containing protein [Hyphomicrobiaceae bacterium]|nr:adenylate/guanylate cyclase domain-containing protein [Hyphomicrobiaceae bacterium]
MPNPAQPDLSTGPLEKVPRTVLFVDVHESMWLMQNDRDGTVRRLLDLLTTSRGMLPQTGGRFVKSTGDGMLLEFVEARAAVAAALAIQEAAGERNALLTPPERLHLRIGADMGEVVISDVDVFGHCVNVAARVTTELAGPGEIVVTANVREGLTAQLDADIEDLGESHLKGIVEPVRCYRVGQPGPSPVIAPGSLAVRVLPTIAVIPFEPLPPLSKDDIVGDELSRALIRAFSRSNNLNVISWRSTIAFRGRSATVAEIGAHLKAGYVLSASYAGDGARIRLDLELSDARTEHVVWAESFYDRTGSPLDPEQELVNRIALGVAQRISAREIQRARTSPLPTLETCTLLIGAIMLMHRRSAHSFVEARRMLDAALSRSPRHPYLLAWLANWHVLRIQQGISDDIGRDRSEALACTSRALDADPDSPFALAMDGLVHTHMTKRHDLATERYQRAVEISPNHALAWLLKGAHNSFVYRCEEGVKDTERALALSPLDLQSYYFDSLCASAHVVAGNDQCALKYADRSLRANRSNASTLRVKAVAQWRLGLLDDARTTAADLLRVEPGFTVSGWLRRTPSGAYESGRAFARVLTEMGIPP